MRKRCGSGALLLLKCSLLFDARLMPAGSSFTRFLLFVTSLPAAGQPGLQAPAAAKPRYLLAAYKRQLARAVDWAPGCAAARLCSRGGAAGCHGTSQHGCCAVARDQGCIQPGEASSAWRGVSFSQVRIRPGEPSRHLGHASHTHACGPFSPHTHLTPTPPPPSLPACRRTPLAMAWCVSGSACWQPS